MPRLLCILSLFCTCVSGLAAQPAADSLARATQLDSILALADDTTKVDLLFRWAANEEMMHFQRAKVGYLHGLRVARRIDDDRTLVANQTRLGNVFIRTGERDAADSILTVALAGAERRNDQVAQVDVLNVLSRLRVAQQDYVAAVEFAERARRLAEKAEYPRGEVAALGSLANVNIVTQDRPAMIKYFTEALELARAHGLDSDVADMSFQLADDAYRYNDLDRVPELVAISRAAARRVGNVRKERQAMNTLALYNNLIGQPGAALQLYDSIQVLNEGRETVSLLGNRAMVYMKLGRFDEAARDIQKAVLRARNANRPGIVQQLYRVAEQTYAELGQYDSAYLYLQRVKQMADTLYQNDRTALAKDLEVQYETAEKEAEIARQETEIFRQRIWLLLIGALGLLTLIAGLIFYNLSRKLRRKNAQNERLVAEKETLIGEIHHRVKNNLQVISSLLQLQSRQLKDENALEALRESQGRVEAMGLIHQKLYQNDDVTSVRAENYLPELGNILLDTYQLDDRVEMYYDVEPTELDVDIAIPLGLIINELVTNSLKYAFPGEREGTIEIGLERDGSELRLRVADDGVGMGKSTVASGTQFGGRLLQLLVQKIGASVSHPAGPGFITELKFTPAPSLAQVEAYG